MSPTSNDWIALARYVSGEATSSERALIDARASADPAFAQLLAESFTGWTAAGVTPRVRDKEGAWAAIQRRVIVSASEDPIVAVGPGVSVSQLLRRSTGYVLAGVIAAALLITIGWIGGMQRRAMHSRLPAATYATANGERATITLLDGTAVVLNVGSRLSVPADYAEGNHTVSLAGEALFSVSHHDRTPFTVVAGAATARVLGTTFIVRHYTTDSASLVAVRDGRVAVNQTVVPASRLVEVSRHGTSPLQPASGATFSFASGVLTLGHGRLADAIPELDRWYNADVRLGDSTLGSRLIEGRFTAGSLSDLAEILTWMFDARVVRDGRVLTLYPRARR